MKKGDRVKCVGLGEGTTYLTEGKEYEVTKGAGAYDMFGVLISTGFQLVDDEGDTIFCRGLDSRHSTWELVE